MIVWKTRKFACVYCTRGHRAKGCSHLNRVLNEVKSKGRPQSQCGNCRSKREKGKGHLHHQCKCGSQPPKEFLEVIQIVFGGGLELHFQEFPGFNRITYQETIDQALETFEVTKENQVVEVCDKKPTEIIVKEIRNENFSEASSACKCHYGGECICSTLPRERKPKTKKQSHTGCSCGCNSEKTDACGCTSSCCAPPPTTSPSTTSAGPSTTSCCAHPANPSTNSSTEQKKSCCV